MQILRREIGEQKGSEKTMKKYMGPWQVTYSQKFDAP
jgi:hypothetical protein